MTREIRNVGKIGNCYGGLNILEKDGSFFWSIENYNGDDWEEITKELFEQLEKHDKTTKEIKK